MIDHHEYKAKQEEILKTLLYLSTQSPDYKNGINIAAHALDELLLEVVGQNEKEVKASKKGGVWRLEDKVARNALRQSLRSIVKGSGK